MKKYLYADGQEVMVNDIVLTPTQRSATVEILLEPGSSLADAYSAPKGGIVLKFDDGDYQVWPEADQDMKFIRRAN